MHVQEILFGVIKASAAIVALGCSIGQAHADGILTLTHQGITRKAVIYEPSAMPAGPAPVVIALHGPSPGAGHGQAIETLRRSLHLDATADREHFLVVYPEAIDGAWSYGRPIAKPMPAINGDPVDDVGFIREIIGNLVASKRGDPSHIYVAGVSRGGLMAYTIACALAEQIAAAATAATSMTQYQREDCHPAKPVPMMVIAGTNDFVQRYDGWLNPLGRLLSVPETMEYWRLENGCSKQDIKVLPHRENSDPTRVWLVNWTGCASGTALRFYRVNGGGHRLPSYSPDSEADINGEAVGNGAADVKKVGFRNHDIETADEIWSFAKDFSR